MSSLPALQVHGIGGRMDLPISYGLAVWGSGIAVLISILVLFVAWRKPYFQQMRVAAQLPSWVSRTVLSSAVRILLGTLGVILWVGSILCGVLGTFQGTDNFAPTFMYVLLWLGIVPLSILLGPIGIWLNPARALHAALMKVGGLDPREGLRPLPEKLGVWPAIVGIFVFTSLELTLFDPSRPLVVGIYLAAVLLLSLAGGMVWGSDFFIWGDPFEAYSRVLADGLSPWQLKADTIELRNPLRGLANVQKPPGYSFFVCMLVGSTAFDGLSRTPKFYTWTTFIEGKDWEAHDGFFQLCLFLSVAIFGLLVALGIKWSMRIAGLPSKGSVRRFSHSILPIALGYLIAHYFSLLVFQSEDVPRLLADPAGEGWHLLPTTNWSVNYRILKPSFIALVQVLGVVIGHIFGVITAHDTALDVLPKKRKIVAQLPLALVMVVITSTAIVILLNG